MPNIAIDPNLSVYALVQRTLQQKTLVNHRHAMSIISYEIENIVIHDKVKARIFAGFQKMSRFLPQVKRYEKLAGNAESVYVFGQMDVQPPPIAGITYVPLQASDQLAKEWFLIADAPEYFSCLATEELSSDGTPDDQRIFQGIWSFDEEMVKILQEWLSSLVDARTLMTEKRNYQKQVMYMSATLGRLTARLAETAQKLTPIAQRTHSELSAVMQEQVAPSVDSAQNNSS